MNLRIAAPLLLSLVALGACAKRDASPRLGSPEPMPSASADGRGPASAGAASPSMSAERMTSKKEASTADYDGAEGEASVSSSPAPPQQQYKPGLGTAYGEQRFSSVRSVQFRRSSSQSPAALLALRYNDAEGVRQISQWKSGGYPQRAVNQSGVLSVTLRDESGSALPGAQVGSDVYAVGETGARYVIGVENNSNQRYEVVASVDGLDVIDGQEADFNKRGYVINPYTSFVIEGWRTSDDTVAAFRFSDMDDSYAERVGKGRNIGVVGVAFFHEEGVSSPDELRRRDSADPFPGRYTPPPPGYRANGG